MKKITTYLFLLTLVLLLSGCFSENSKNDNINSHFTHEESEDIFSNIYNISYNIQNEIVNSNLALLSTKKSLNKHLKIDGGTTSFDTTIQGEGGGTCYITLSYTEQFDESFTSVKYIISGIITYDHYKEFPDSDYVFNGSTTVNYEISYSNILTDNMTDLISESISTSDDFTVNNISYNMNMIFNVTFPDITISYSGTVNNDSFKGTVNNI